MSNFLAITLDLGPNHKRGGRPVKYDAPFAELSSNKMKALTAADYARAPHAS